MKLTSCRAVTFLLIFALGAGWLQPPQAQAEDDGEATNITMGLVAVVAVVFIVVAWRMDSVRSDDMIAASRDIRLTPRADDDLALVLTDWQAADVERAEAVSGIGIRAWF